MELRSSGVYCSFLAVAALFCSSLVFAGDIVHRDDTSPKRPGCENNFVLVKLLSFFHFILQFIHVVYAMLIFFPFLLGIVICDLVFLHSLVVVDWFLILAR